MGVLHHDEEEFFLFPFHYTLYIPPNFFSYDREIVLDSCYRIHGLMIFLKNSHQKKEMTHALHFRSLTDVSYHP
jgi:hypothetical protein